MFYFAVKIGKKAPIFDKKFLNLAENQQKTPKNSQFIMKISNFISLNELHSRHAIVDADRQVDKACFKRLDCQEHKAD